MAARTTADPQRAKALSVIREGRLTVLHAACHKTAHEVDEVIARVQSSRPGGAVYAIDFAAGLWSCTCGDVECPHVIAVRLVTGHGAS